MSRNLHQRRPVGGKVKNDSQESCAAPYEGIKTHSQGWLPPYVFDSQSVALARIMLGLTVVFDQCQRFIDAEAFLSDSGVLSRQFMKHFISGDRLCVHLLTGTVFGQRLLCSAGVTSGIALTLGIWPRIAAFVAWLLTQSAHDRALFTVNSSDELLVLMLFFAQFLSLDNLPLSVRLRPSGNHDNPTQVSGVGPLCWMGQILLVYWSSVFLKLTADDPQWWEGTTLQRALQYAPLARQPQSAWLVSRPNLSTLVTWTSLLVEVVGPMLTLVPLARLRFVGVLLMWTFHWGTGMFLELGLYPWIGFVFFIPLLPENLLQARRLRHLGHGKSHVSVANVQKVIPGRLLLSSLKQAIPLLSLLLGLVSVVQRDFRPDIKLWQPAVRLMRAGHLDQRWNMFVTPFERTEWRIMIGQLVNGSAVTVQLGGPAGNTVDIFHNDPNFNQPPLAMPASYHASFQNQRWRYLIQNWFGMQQVMNVPVSKYICSLANRHRQVLELLRVQHVVRPIGLNGTLGKHMSTAFIYDCLRGEMQVVPKR